MDDFEEYSRYEHDDKIKFMMPSMIEDFKQLLKERENMKTLYDSYLKTRPSSNREANADRYVTSIRFVIETLNKRIKYYGFSADKGLLKIQDNDFYTVASIV